MIGTSYMARKERKEFYRITSELSELVDYSEDLSAACDRCPYCAECEAHQLYWGCGAWEESMGEDL